MLFLFLQERKMVNELCDEIWYVKITKYDVFLQQTDSIIYYHRPYQNSQKYGNLSKSPQTSISSIKRDLKRAWKLAQCSTSLTSTILHSPQLPKCQYELNLKPLFCKRFSHYSPYSLVSSLTTRQHNLQAIPGRSGPALHHHAARSSRNAHTQTRTGMQTREHGYAYRSVECHWHLSCDR